MTINLSGFLDKEVTITLTNGKTITGTLTSSLGKVVTFLSTHYPYFMDADVDAILCWTTAGKSFRIYETEYDIVSSEENRVNLQTIQDKIISRFDKDYNDFLSYLGQEDNPDIKEFLEKYLDWYVNKPMLLYQMFNGVIHQDDNYVWSSLISFIGNHFKDDSYFTIQWMTVNDKPTDDKEDMFSFPVLISDQDNGTQMEQYEINESLYEKCYYDT